MLALQHIMGKIRWLCDKQTLLMRQAHGPGVAFFSSAVSLFCFRLQACGQSALAQLAASELSSDVKSVAIDEAESDREAR